MRRHSLVVVGAGGNIGSHLVPHLGRMGLDRVVLIDRDTYTDRNLAGQDIVPSDVGRAKARVQARRLSAIDPGLGVSALHASVEDVPLGRLRADAILACLDSRRARQSVGEAALHLGVPWIDAGVAVLGGALLARVSVYAPGADAPCLECAWSERDYALVEQEYACASEPHAARKVGPRALAAAGPPATGAPSSLGALAASLQAIECRLWLAGDTRRAGRQTIVDAAHGTLNVTRFERRASCRNQEHGPWTTVVLPTPALERPVADWLARGALRIEGGRFERRLMCPRCGASRRRLRLVEGAARSPRCPGCHEPLRGVGFARVEWLRAEELSAAERARSLRQLGIRAGDVLALSGRDGTARLELGSPDSAFSPTAVEVR